MDCMEEDKNIFSSTKSYIFQIVAVQRKWLIHESCVPTICGIAQYYPRQWKSFNLQTWITQFIENISLIWLQVYTNIVTENILAHLPTSKYRFVAPYTTMD